MPTYPVLASTLAAHPSLQIYRTYSALNVKSILYYQAELAHLESELAEVEDADRLRSHSDSIRREFCEDWWSLRHGDPARPCNSNTSTSGSSATAVAPSRSRSTSPMTRMSSETNECARRKAETRQWNLICRIRVVLDEYRNEPALCRRRGFFLSWCRS